MSIDNILLKAKYLVKRYGIKIVVIDPYNKVEHMRDRNETETEYISKLLDKLTSFSKRYDVLTILVAHPTKLKKEAKEYDEMVNRVGCFGTRDLLALDGITAELANRGVEVTSSIEFQ